MRTVCSKDMCAGCYACVEKCRKNAIHIEKSMTAYNAVIDSSKCIDCNACKIVCQSVNRVELKDPIEWKQGWAKDNAIRKTGSSGGVATAIEKAFVLQGGCVCSCCFEEGDFRFKFANTADDIGFSGSKYVKSNPFGIYEKIKELLGQGKRVLFVGLPCQVAAVKKYVGSNLEENLFTIDLICHGTPSPELLSLFLEQKGLDVAQIQSIKFREKTNFQIIKNNKSIGAHGASDSYSIAFLNAMTYTDNCYSCVYAQKSRPSDITLGDSWGSELAVEEQKAGISLVLIQTKKGKMLAESANLYFENVDLDKAVMNNHQLSEPSKKHKNRALFFKGLNKGKSFEYMVARCLPKRYFKQRVKGMLIRMRVIK